MSGGLRGYLAETILDGRPPAACFGVERPSVRIIVGIDRLHIASLYSSSNQKQLRV